MKHLIVKAYILIIGQVAALLTSGYMMYSHYTAYRTLLNVPKVHLWIQVIIGVSTWYVLHHFVKVIKQSSQMRKAAQEQKEANSRWVEALIFVLMMSVIFLAIFYTAPFRRYYPSSWEHVVYLFNGILGIVVLVSVMSSQHHISSDFIKKKQKYALLGGIGGLLLFFVYYQLMI